MYTLQDWNEWANKELKNYSEVNGSKKYLKKGYLHFDDRFWFPERKKEIQSLLSNPKKIEKRAFLPFLKFNINTPRYKYDEAQQDRCIEYKKRPICFASHVDSLIYSFYAHCLTNKYEKYIFHNHINECVLAYRTDLDACNIDFARKVFEYISSKGPCTAIALDIKNFFPSLDHQILKKNWIEVLPTDKLPPDQYKIFRSISKFSYVNRNTLLKHLGIDLSKTNPKSLLDLFPEERDYQKFNRLRKSNIITTNSQNHGIPQGSPISAVLSNIYMIDFDKKMMEYASPSNYNFLYRRYCDDILIVCDTNDVNVVKKFAYKEIEKIKLTIQKTKEEEVIFLKNRKGILRGYDAKKLSFNSNFNTVPDDKNYKYLQYLGFEFNGQNVYIRSSSLSRYFRKLKKRVTKTVKMAYSPKAKGNKILTRKLYHLYTHLGKRNFISYALNASSKFYENSKGERKKGLNSSTIKKQVKNHFKILKDDLERKNKRIASKKAEGNTKKIKR